MKKKQATYYFDMKGNPIPANRMARKIAYLYSNRKTSWSDSMYSIPAIFPLIATLGKDGKKSYKRIG